MPVSKKPLSKKPPPSRSKSPPPSPDPRALESILAEITGRSGAGAIEAAQNVMYDAWDQRDSRSRIALARKALAISPLCADAYNLLAGQAATVVESRDLYARGLAAAERVLGPKGFREYDGHFWGFLETRPYMRARHGLALMLLELGQEDAAIEHFRAMLELNPNDNQGIRYVLLARLMRRDDAEAAKTLIAAYANEGSAEWLYSRALIAYREGRTLDAATSKLLDDARETNPFVPAILAGARKAARSKTGFIAAGSEDEAVEYVAQFGPVWERTPGAIGWLATVLDVGAGMTRRTAKRAN